MGTPREYGFNDISNEHILKADPLSSFLNVFIYFFAALSQSDPF